VCVDLADWTATRQAVEALPPIDLLVNNAGVINRDKFVDITPEEFDRILNVNLKAVMNVSQVVAKGLIARGSPGSIVNVSSQASVRAFDSRAIYGSSKAALVQLTRVMCLELGPHKIRVNAVNPTVVLTDMSRHWETSAALKEKLAALKERTPLRSFADVSEIAGPTLFLLSDAASMISGTILLIDGGFTVT